MDDFDLDWFLEVARGLLAIGSTADRPAELHRALEYVLDFIGPGFTVQRFESGGKPSALVGASGWKLLTRQLSDGGWRLAKVEHGSSGW